LQDFKSNNNLFPLLILFASASFAQEATVLRNVNLRADPSTANPPIKLLQSGTTVTLLATTQQGGFYHVRTEDGEEGWVWSKNVTVSAVPSPAPSTSAQCDDSLWDHVYNPQRLIVKQKCIAITGTTVDATNGTNADGVRHEADGDTHGWLKLDPAFTNLLNAGNLSDEGGNMVFEIVCKYRVTQGDAKAACPPTYQNQVQIPPVGSHVRIVGTYVQDTNHSKWMEIHPVSSMTVIP
jgi:Bacterial SH3 domain